MSVCLVLCVCRGSKYSEVVPDWLILNSDLYGTIHDCGPLWSHTAEHCWKYNHDFDSITDTDDDSDLVADVDPDTLVRIVRTELKTGKAPGIDNVYNTILKKAIGTGFYKVLARAFTISLKLGFIPHVWKIAVLCMLIKPDKPPSQTTSYRPISLLSAIMKLFEWVIEKSSSETS